MNGRIAIIIPSHNREKLLAETLESCRRQTHGDFEVVVVDDESEDGTAAVASGFAERDKRFSVRRVKRRGQCACRNVGLSETQAGWIKFLDSDDLLTDWALEHQLQLARKYKADIVAGGVVGFWTEELAGVRKQIAPPEDDESCTLYRSLLEMNRDHAHTFNEILIRRELVEGAGGFDAGLRAAEEINLHYRITMRNPDLCVVHGDKTIVLLKRYDLNSLAATLRREKKEPWVMRSYRSASEEYIRGGFSAGEEFKNELQALFYKSLILAARNASMEEALTALKVWEKFGAQVPELSPWYHELLHRRLGFKAAEKILSMMRCLRNLLRSHRSRSE